MSQINDYPPEPLGYCPGCIGTIEGKHAEGCVFGQSSAESTLEACETGGSQDIFEQVFGMTPLLRGEKPMDLSKVADEVYYEYQGGAVAW